MKTKTVEKEEIKKEVSCDKCEGGNCMSGSCMHGNCSGGVCRGGSCRSIGWRIVSVIFRVVLMIAIIAIVFVTGAAVGGAGVSRYISGGDYLYGPGMMSKGMMGGWEYKSEGIMRNEPGSRQVMGLFGCDGNNVARQNMVRVFGNIVSVGEGELVISDNSGKDMTVVSGSFTIIETSKGELGIKDLKVDEGVTVYGVLVDGGKIKASNIKVSR